MTKTKIQEVKSNFDAFLKEAKALRIELKNRQEEVDRLKIELTSAKNEIAGLHAQLSNRDIAEAVVGTNGNTTNEAKQKITELMREIDSCIALLNV